MSQHPEVERKLRQVLDTTLQGRAPQPEDLPRLAYTEKVIKEAMRLYPPAWGLGRTAIKSCEVGGYQVPAQIAFYGAFMGWWAVQDSLPNDPRNRNKTAKIVVLPSVYAGLRFVATLAKVSPS